MKREPGSAETGGEKADEVCPICGTLDYGCCPAVAIGDPWVCLKHRVHRRDFGEDLADMVKAFPTVPRSSQNQTVSTGVEGAHAGTTADEKGGEPEKFIMDVRPRRPGETAEHLRKVTREVVPDEGYLNDPDTDPDEPEKLNNAQNWPPTITLSHGAPPAGSPPIVALAESSLSSPPHLDDE